jgi:ribosome biogenesis GTPase / thiamine phosphate phosphatase
MAAYGRQFVVEGSNGMSVSCVTRGKRIDICVGDRVDWASSGDGTGIIENIQTRTSLLQRADYRRTKLMAANIDLVVCVVASEPSFSEALLNRVLIASSEADLPVLIIASKADLAESMQRIEPRLHLFESLGYSVARIAPKTDPDGTVETLRPYFEGKTSVLLGQSGMGKSTLVNHLVPNASLAVREISIVLASGKHTTTFSKAFRLSAHGFSGTIIDSPGFQEFGLSHLHPSQVEHGMPEFKQLLGQCQFRDCRHMDEPGCAVKKALGESKIDQRRYDAFDSVMRDLDFYRQAAWKMPKR